MQKVLSQKLEEAYQLLDEQGLLRGLLYPEADSAKKAGSTRRAVPAVYVRRRPTVFGE